jgi:hypothetical protein
MISSTFEWVQEWGRGQITANFVKKIEVGNENEPSEEEISEVVEKARA